MIKKYEKYKDSGVEWIGEIPEGWDISSIGRYTNLGRGRVISHLEIQEKPGQYPVYSSQTEHNGVMGLIDTYDFEGEYVTWTTDGANAGTVSYRKGKFNCTNVCGTIQPRDFEQIDLGFLPYLLNLGTKFSVRLDINPKLMNNMMAKIPLVIPSKTEQTAIASFLDRKTAEIDQLITNKEKLIALYEEEKTAIINQAVTKGLDPKVKTKPSGIEWLGDIPEYWEVKKLKYLKAMVKNSFVDGPFGSHLKTEHFVVNGDVYVIDSGYITSGNFVHHREFKTITKEHFETIRRSECTEHDIIIAKIGANFGTSGILPKLDKPSVVSGNSLKLTIGRGYNLKYVHYHLINLKQNGVIDIEVKGSAQPALSMQLVSEMPFIKTNEDEQFAIVSHIETECSRLDTIIEKFKKQIELFKEYRITLISEVVTGKIDVREGVAA